MYHVGDELGIQADAEPEYEFLELARREFGCALAAVDVSIKYLEGPHQPPFAVIVALQYLTQPSHHICL